MTDGHAANRSAQDLAGRTVLVVGASRGIGASVASDMASRGADVAISARSRTALDEVADAISAAGGRVAAVPGDVTDPASPAAVVAQAETLLGPIDVLVYAAGRSAVGRFEELDDAQWADCHEVNVMGAVRYARAVLPGMTDQGWGRIINVASTAAKYGSRFQSAYNASKHALLGFTRCLALEAAQTGITVNAICPGFVETEMVRDAVPDWAKVTGLPEDQVIGALLTRVPIGRMLESSEVAALACYLASDAAGGMTGQGLTLDGGLILV